MWQPAVTGGKAMSVKEKLILQVMEEMEVSRDVAVEIVGGKEEEEEEVDEVIKVVLIHPQSCLSVSQSGSASANLHVQVML